MQVTIPLVPHYTVSIQLFSNVTNSLEILSAIRAHKAQYTQYCFLDSRRICSRDQLFSAVTRAIKDQEDGLMRTKSLLSEVVYDLGYNANISDAFKLFGITENSEALLCIAVQKVNDTMRLDGASLVHGTEGDVTDDNLLKHCDLAKLCSVINTIQADLTKTNVGRHTDSIQKLMWKKSKSKY